MARERQFYEYVLGNVVLRTLLLLGIITFGFLAAENWVVRWDLTEDERFSISPASHEIAGSLADPLTIRAYFSDKIPDRFVPLQRYVFDILDEYVAHGNGRIKVERYDPLESTAVESEASTFGVHPTELPLVEATQQSVTKVYGSIVLVYGDRQSEVIDIARRYLHGYDGLAVLEYELSSRIWQLTHDRPRIGLTGYLEDQDRGNPFTGMPGGPRPEFTGIRSLLGEAFELEDVDLDREEVDPKKVPLLLVVRPKEFTDVALFRLDQYLMRGGRVLLFITQGTFDFRYEYAYQPFKTGLDGWLEHHGVRVPNEFVCHLVNAMPDEVPTGTVDTPLGRAQRIERLPNWFWPLFGAKGTFDQDNPAVQRLKTIPLWWVHPVDVLESRLGEKRATVLIRSHESESWRWKDLRRVDRRKLVQRRDRPSASDLKSSAVAVAIEGTFTSYFADKPVPPSLVAKSKGSGEDAGSPAGSTESGSDSPGAAGREKPAAPAEGVTPAEGEEKGEGPTGGSEEAGEASSEGAEGKQASSEGPEEKEAPAEGAEEKGEPGAGAEEVPGQGEGSGEVPAEGETKGGAAAEGEEKGGTPAAAERKGASGPDVVKESVVPTQLVVIGNSFFISDALLGRGGEQAAAISSLALNLVDWLARSPELIALRAKRYNDRRLMDEVEDQQKELIEKLERSEIDVAEAQETIDRVEEAQKQRWKRSRWINILAPCFAIVVAGAVVWVVRAGARAGPPRVPPAVPPESLRGGGTDA